MVPLEQCIIIKQMLNTNQGLPSPVILVVEDVSVSVEQVSEEFPQIVVIWLFKEIESTNVSQISGHLFCSTHTGPDTQFTHKFIHKDKRTIRSTHAPKHSFSEKISMNTNLGSFHRGPQSACPSLCLLSSDNALSECQPNNDSKEEEISQATETEKKIGRIKTLDNWSAVSSP